MQAGCHKRGYKAGIVNMVYNKFAIRRQVTDLSEGSKKEIYRANSRLAPSQWETSLLSNAVSHWLGTNLEAALIYITFVCFITKSFLTYSLFFPPTPALSTISRHLSCSMCSITPETASVGSSYNCMRGPGTGCGFSDLSNCSHWSLTLTFQLNGRLNFRWHMKK